MRTCPECRLPSKVIKTADTDDYTRRRRECRNGHRFTTYETYELGTLARLLIKAAAGLDPRDTGDADMIAEDIKDHITEAIEGQTWELPGALIDAIRDEVTAEVEAVLPEIPALE
jgi:transcriptional regulator NrdR family protein